MAIYIIIPIVLAIAILLLIRVFCHKFPTQKEREKATDEKKREESEQLINFKWAIKGWPSGRRRESRRCSHRETLRQDRKSWLKTFVSLW